MLLLTGCDDAWIYWAILEMYSEVGMLRVGYDSEETIVVNIMELSGLEGMVPD